MIEAIALRPPFSTKNEDIVVINNQSLRFCLNYTTKNKINSVWDGPWRKRNQNEWISRQQRYWLTYHVILIYFLLSLLPSPPITASMVKEQPASSIRGNLSPINQHPRENSIPGEDYSSIRRNLSPRECYSRKGLRGYSFSSMWNIMLKLNSLKKPRICW